MQRRFSDDMLLTDGFWNNVKFRKKLKIVKFRYIDKFIVKCAPYSGWVIIDNDALSLYNNDSGLS